MNTIEADQKEMEFAILSSQFITLTNHLTMQDNHTINHRHALELANGTKDVDQINQLLKINIHLEHV